MCVSRSGALRANGGVGELWLSREAGPAKRIVDGRTKVLYERGGTPLSEAGIAGCSFSPDERSLYFLADKYGTSAGLYEVILDKGTLIFLGAANALRVVNTCTDPALVGTLAIYRHDYVQPLKGFAFDWWVLIRPRTGAQIGAIGYSDENLDRFLAVRCGQGEAPPDPPPLRQWECARGITAG